MFANGCASFNSVCNSSENLPCMRLDLDMIQTLDGKRHGTLTSIEQKGIWTPALYIQQYLQAKYLIINGGWINIDTKINWTRHKHIITREGLRLGFPWWVTQLVRLPTIYKASCQECGGKLHSCLDNILKKTNNVEDKMCRKNVEAKACLPIGKNINCTCCNLQQKTKLEEPCTRESIWVGNG